MEIQKRIDELDAQIESMHNPYYEILFKDGSKGEFDIYCFDDEIIDLNSIQEINLKENSENLI